MNTRFYGVLYSLAAFTAWGFLPAYWKQLQAVEPIEILCHRAVWSCVFLCLIVSCQKRWPEVMTTIRDVTQIKWLTISGLLIGFNWFVYIWAVNAGHVVETSLGYYITPMVNVLLGFLLLGERFSRPQLVSFVCVLTGIGYSLAGYGDFPAFGLTLALSFAFYGYARKRIMIKPIPGLLIETCVLVVPALGYIGWRAFSARSLFLQQTDTTLWLIGSGLATSLPLLWFAAATSRLKLSTIGIVQYLAPTIAFFLGVFVYREAFSLDHLVTFGLIWLGVGIYCLGALRQIGAIRMTGSYKQT